MIDESERVRSLIARQAAEWFVANREGLAAQQCAAFTEWLRASPVHVEEYLGLAAIARDLREACAELAPFTDALIEQARIPERNAVVPLRARFVAALRGPRAFPWTAAAASLASLAFVGVGLGLFWRSMSAGVTVVPEPPAQHFATGHGEQMTYRLTDDTVVHLNTDSAVTVRYGRGRRLVELDAGEADFDVTHESGREFIVVAGQVSVVDLGTRFDVRTEPGQTVVTVIEGRVAVSPTPGPGSAEATRRPGDAASSVVVGAEQQFRVIDGVWPAAPVSVNAGNVVAWMQRRIRFDREPLEQVAAEYNRYSVTPIEITTPALRNLQVSGNLATDDPDAFVAFLRTLPRVHVSTGATRIRISQAPLGASSHQP